METAPVKVGDEFAVIAAVRVVVAVQASTTHFGPLAAQQYALECFAEFRIEYAINYGIKG